MTAFYGLIAGFHRKINCSWYLFAVDFFDVSPVSACVKRAIWRDRAKHTQHQLPKINATRWQATHEESNRWVLTMFLNN